MATMHEIPDVGPKELRSFGITTGVILVGLFWLFFPWLLERPRPNWPLVIAAVLVVWGLVAPVTLRPVFRGWMRFGLLMSRITTPIIMGIIFFAVIFPVALILRALRWDPLRRTTDANADTYRVPGDPAAKDRLERPY